MNKNLIVFTGAGLSADSGIQTFRDSDGLWENHKVEVVATLSTWKRNFETVHRFYNARRAQLSEVKPNAAHVMIADWQKRYNTTVITQNIDDLLERAGATDVIHVHGNLREIKCTACGEVTDIGYDVWNYLEGRCSCGCLKGMKPNVIFFGETAPEYPKMWRTFKQMTKDDILVVIGTSGQVIDIGGVAAISPATSILSNLETNETMSMPGRPVINDWQFDHILHGRASEMAPEIDKLVKELMG